jgi:zinc transporter 9
MVTGNAVWDAIGSFVIAALLALVAIVLVLKNRSHLLGRSLPEEMREEVVALLNAEPAIEHVVDFKSTEMGFGVYRVKCEVEFNGGTLAREMFEDWSVEDQFEDARESVEAFTRVMVDSVDRVPRLIGQTVDVIESRIQKKFPQIHHIDIEIN